MIIYAGFVFGLVIIGLTIKVAKEEDGLATLISVFLFLPIFGRIFGWW